MNMTDGMNPTDDATPSRDAATTALDVRPILATGEEPLELILETAVGVSEGNVLKITAPFEPVPLYAVLGARGFAHLTEMRAPDEFVVRFTQTGITGESTVSDVYDRHPAAGRPALSRFEKNARKHVRELVAVNEAEGWRLEAGGLRLEAGGWRLEA